MAETSATKRRCASHAQMTSVSQRSVNVGLRSVTLFTRFLFVFFIAKYLSPEMVGNYGIFTATVGFLVLAVGLDYYTFTSREIFRLDDLHRGQLLKGQIALSGALYFIILPATVLVLLILSWPNVLLWWLIPIVVLDHFNQEVFRLLIVLNNQIFASVLLFLRQGIWAIVVVVLFISFPEIRQLNTVFTLWTISGLFSAALGFWKLKRMNFGGWDQPISWGGVRKGIGISVGFLMGTLAIRAIHTTDRYWLEALSGHEVLAAYVLYFGVASALIAFLDAGVFAFTYPKLIQNFYQKEGDLARVLMHKALMQTITLCVAFGIISWLSLPWLLAWIDNPVYKNEIGLYPWLLSATILHALGMIPQYVLYARGMRNHIIFSNIAAFVTFTVSVWALSGIVSGMSVLYSLNLSFTVMLAIKLTALLKIKT